MPAKRNPAQGQKQPGKGAEMHRVARLALANRRKAAEEAILGIPKANLGVARKKVRSADGNPASAEAILRALPAYERRIFLGQRMREIVGEKQRRQIARAAAEMALKKVAPKLKGAKKTNIIDFSGELDYLKAAQPGLLILHEHAQGNLLEAVGKALHTEKAKSEFWREFERAKIAIRSAMRTQMRNEKKRKA